MTMAENPSRYPETGLISFVLPVYNEEANLEDFYQKIVTVMRNHPAAYELVFVDDGSTDSSFDVLSAIYQHADNVKVVRFRKNFGKSAAYNVGFRQAKGDVIVTMDTDLQEDPGDLPLFMEKINQGYDMVVGWRYDRKESVSKRLFSKIFNRVVSLVTRIPLHDFNCPFKVYRKAVLAEIEIYGELHRYIPVLAHSKGFLLGEVKIRHLPRIHGISKYGMERYHRGLLDLLTVVFITRFAKRPLHFLGLGGLSVCAVGFGILLFFTAAHFLYVFDLLSESRWRIHERPFLSLGILLMIVGAQFFSLGLLGELFITRTGAGGQKAGYSIAEILGDDTDGG
jgi:glycosyltransferase involved in cell wall biosynthesis